MVFFIFYFQMSKYRCNVIAILVVVVLLAVNLTKGQSENFPYREKRQEGPATHYCGKRLSNALQIFCNGVYNSMFKKSGFGMYFFKLIIITIFNF